MAYLRFFVFFILCSSLPVGCSSNDISSPISPENKNGDSTGKPYVQCTINMPDGSTIAYTSSTGSLLHSMYTYTSETSMSNFSLSYSTLSIAGAFEGQKNQQYALGNEHQLSLSSPLGKPVPLPRITSESGTMVIEALAAEKQSLRGTFSGVFTSANGETYTVTNGKFYLQGK